MSQTENVTLKIKAGTQNGNGWTPVTASNGQPYSYKYTGGQNDNGNMNTVVNTGAATINLNLDTDNRYGIQGINFTDANQQLSWTPVTSATATISDANTVVEEATYCVQVTDSNASNAVITCDPMISNDPRTARVMHAAQ